MLSFIKNLFANKKDSSTICQPNKLDDYLSIALQIPGWVDRNELMYKAKIMQQLPVNPVIVEIGCFRPFYDCDGRCEKNDWKRIVHVIDPLMHRVIPFQFLSIN